MVTKVSTPRTATLETGNTTLQVTINGPSTVEVTGTFGSVLLSTSTEPALAERTIAAAERFKSEMIDMLFTLTGTGPVVVTITPLENSKIFTFE